MDAEINALITIIENSQVSDETKQKVIKILNRHFSKPRFSSPDSLF